MKTRIKSNQIHKKTVQTQLSIKPWPKSKQTWPFHCFSYFSSTKIIDDKIVIKDKKKDDLNKIYKYLDSRSFDYFPKPILIDNNYELYPFIEDSYEPREQKAVDLMHLLSLLHSKTTFYREVDIDHNKQIYEDILINLESYKSLSIKIKDDLNIYENYIVSNNTYYNYDGKIIYKSK